MSARAAGQVASVKFAADSAVPDDPRARPLLAERAFAGAQMAAGVAYGIEGPVARLLATVEDAVFMLGAGAEGEDDVGALLESALHEARALASLTRSLAGLTRGDARPVAIHVHQPLELALRLVSRELTMRGRVFRRYEAAACIRADHRKLAAAFAAILRNAAESIPPFIPTANSIIVSTGETTDGDVFVEIADTGTGIAPEDLPHVAEPFFTTKSGERGASAGLSLTNARAAVLEAGGSMSIESTEGHGTRVRMTFPKTDAVVAPPVWHAEPESSARRVLVVADDAVEGAVVRRLFGDDGARVAVASLPEALERLATGDAFELVVCGESSGIAARLRAELVHVAPEYLARTFEVSTRSDDSAVRLVARPRTA